MGRSGHKVLWDMDNTAERIRSDIRDLNYKISDTEKKLDSLQREEAETYLALAEVRMELLEDPKVKTQLSQAEKAATDAISARQDTRTSLNEELSENQEKQKQLETQRNEIVTEIEDDFVKVKDAEKAVEIKLENDKTYLKFFEDIKKIENRILRVEQKILLAREDYQNKSKPYYADPLFLYLKQRQYGTSAYSALPLFRVADDWVANVANYETARRDFAALHSIPGKLVQHKQMLEKNIESIEQEKKAHKQEQLKKDGVDKIQQEYLQNQKRLDEIDLKLEDLEKEHARILQKKTEYAGQVDDYYAQAMSTLQNLYKTKSLTNLKRFAAMTATPDDDSLVKHLFKTEESIENYNKKLSSYKYSLEQENNKLKKLQDARKTFKEKRYDVRKSDFEDSKMFKTLLGEFLVGLLSNRSFWRSVGYLVGEVLDELDLD